MSTIHSERVVRNSEFLLTAHRTGERRYPSAVRSPLPLPLVLLLGVALALFVNQAWSADIGPVPIQAVLVWLIAAWLFLFRGSKMFRALSVFSPAQKIAIVALAGSALLRGMLDDWNMLRVAQILTGVMLALLAVVFFRDTRGRRMLFISLTLAAATSSTVAILQWLDLSPELWQRSVYSNVGYFTYGATGLEETPVPYAYSVVGIGAVLVAGWMLAGNRLPRWLPFSPGFAFLFSAVIFVGLLASQSRSGLLGLVIGTGILALGARRLKLRTVIPLLIAVALGSIALGYVLTIREVAVLEDHRLFATWIVYIPTMFEFPLGRPAFVSLDDLLYQAYADASAVPEIAQSLLTWQTIAPHNLFLTTGMAYGPLAVLALLFLYASMLGGGLKSVRYYAEKGDVVSAVWVLVFIAANVAVLVHSWFHNASIAVGEMRSWLWVGLLLSQTHPAIKKKRALRTDWAVRHQALHQLKS